MGKFEANTPSFLKKLQELKISIDTQKKRITKNYNSKNKLLSTIENKYLKNINNEDGILDVDMSEITTLASAVNRDLLAYNDILKHEIKVAELHFKTIQHEDSKLGGGSSGDSLQLDNIQLDEDLIAQIHEEAANQISNNDNEIKNNKKTYAIE